VQDELPGERAGQGQEKMENRGWIEDVPAAGFDRGHAAEEVGVPERQPAQRLNVLDKKLPKHDASRDGVLAQ
jgi:hypothetical protein